MIDAGWLDVKAVVGADVSTTIESALDVADNPLPAVSVIVTLHVPSASVPKVQLPETSVQVTSVDPAFVALRTAVPESVPETEKVGVLSLVELSVEEVPKSEDVERSGADGVATVVLMSTVETVEVFPVASFTTMCALYAVPAINPVTLAVMADAVAELVPLAEAVPCAKTVELVGAVCVAG